MREVFSIVSKFTVAATTNALSAQCSSDKMGRTIRRTPYEDAMQRQAQKQSNPAMKRMRYKESGPLGPEINRLTSSDHCDPRTRTPYHKYVPVRLQAAEKTDSSATKHA